MDDLIPLFIFIIIAIVNGVKFLSGRNAKQNKPAVPSPRRPAGLDSLFEELSEKMSPQPTRLAEWPEHVPKPDYVEQMRAGGALKKQVQPAPEPPEFQMPPVTLQNVVAPAMVGRTAKAQACTGNRAMPGLKSQSISLPPMLRSASGKTHFRMNNRKQLRQAILANAVFGPPRAYDTAFENTMIK
ncbi:MAG: hypothetical protein JXR25_05555 [Pontiellaceae bacterium]|nr:hypothetical protein [Pontiellaceae bacterium]MBN2784272.1 hypothetical protein [Pontiellaceae bacterium]